MSKTLLLISLLVVALITSCDKKSPGNDYDLTNALNSYVTLTSTKPIDVVEGDSVSISFTMRTAFQQKVTVYYAVSSPVNLVDQSVIIGRNLLKAKGTFKIPEGIITDSSGTETAVLSVTKATTDDGQILTIGRYNDSTAQKVNIVISVP
jgi:hypothetical protein